MKSIKPCSASNGRSSTAMHPLQVDGVEYAKPSCIWGIHSCLALEYQADPLYRDRLPEEMSKTGTPLLISNLRSICIYPIIGTNVINSGEVRSPLVELWWLLTPSFEISSLLGIENSRSSCSFWSSPHTIPFVLRVRLLCTCFSSCHWKCMPVDSIMYNSLSIPSKIFLFLFFAKLLTISHGALVNVTVDDLNGDSRTGAVPIYGPPGSRWIDSESCSECPYGAPEAHDGTWHLSTTDPGGITDTINYTFSGMLKLYHYS